MEKTKHKNKYCKTCYIAGINVGKDEAIKEVLKKLIKELQGEFGKESNIYFRIEMVLRKVFGWEELKAQLEKLNGKN